MASHERSRLFFLEGSLILILSIGSVISKNSYSCGAGLNTPGYTVPEGDIPVEYPNSLDILCVLKSEEAWKYGPNPSSLMSIVWASHKQPVDIVNSTAIRLHIENHNKTSSLSYTCMVNGSFVCHNIVSVGTKPERVTDFDCIGHNYDNLTCTWTGPENYVKTNYSLQYTVTTTKPPRSIALCPDLKEIKGDRIIKYECTWSISTVPQYRHSHDFFLFTLQAFNTFGKESWPYYIDHHAHVIPNAPENLTGNATSPHSIKLKWFISVSMQGFPGAIEYRVMWWIESNKYWVTLPPVVVPKIERRVLEYELTNLPYAHCLYDIRVSMKTLKATEEKMWSQNSSVTVWTKSKLPDRPPRTDIGAFEIQGYGNTIVYWQNIYDYEQNGQLFSYHIEVDGHPDIKPKKSSSNYAKFENLTEESYTFKIWSKNELGMSVDYSTVFIPALDRALKPPLKLIKVDRGLGVYDLEWVINDDSKVTNYTLFWCADPKDRPYQCDGTLNWTVVQRDKKSITFQLEGTNEETNRSKNYQFAISANGYQVSSGMLWAECTVIPGRGTKLSQAYVKNTGPRFISVMWKLECVKMGDIKGFNITYCPLGSQVQSTECKKNSLNYTIISGATEGERVIDGLTPYTRYKIRIKPLLLNGEESEFSEPMINTTLADKPSEPRNLSVINKSDSSLLVQWKKPAQENGVIMRYEVFVNNVHKKTVTPQTNQTSFEANLVNLTSRTNYTLRVEACVSDCSQAVVTSETEIGRPSVVPKPSANWDNNSLIVRWDKPYPTNLEVDEYEVSVGTKDRRDGEIFHVKGQTYVVATCEKDKSKKVYVMVRAVNKPPGREVLKGPWSEGAEFPCFRSPTSETWVTIIIVVSIIIFIALMIYLTKRVYEILRKMRNLPVKLPDGLAAAVETFQEKEKHMDETLPADEPLLSKKFPNQPRNPSGESSGCCSGTESVSSSVESASHLSMSDSGTEQPRSPSLADIEGSRALRQRPNVKKSDYVTMPEIAQATWSPKQNQGGYSVIGLAAPPKKPESGPEYMALSDIPAKSSYVQFPIPQTKEPLKEPPVRPPPSGYVPYMEQEPAAKNTDYVLAGVPTKPNLVSPKVPLFTQREETSSGYVKAPPMSMEPPKLLIPWQQHAQVEPPSTGYVVVGDPKSQKGVLDMQKGSKGYVPHNIKYDTTKSIKED